MSIKKKDFFKAARIYNKVFNKEVEQDRQEYLKRKNKLKQEVFVLAYGSECIDDYDVEVGIFTSKESLKKAYDTLYERKQREVNEDGFSLIDTIKIYSYYVVDELTEELHNNKYRISLNALGFLE